jgi:hypothetical protein
MPFSCSIASSPYCDAHQMICLFSSKWRIHVILLVILLIHSCIALTHDEIFAVEKMVERWPPLLQLSERPWLVNGSLACEPSYFYGVECIYEPETHIVGLYGRHLFSKQNWPYFFPLLLILIFCTVYDEPPQ